MELQEALSEHLGGFGLYQLYVVILSQVLFMPNAIHNMGYVFYAATPKFRCLRQKRNGVVNLTDMQWLNFSTPRKPNGNYDHCSIYTWASDNSNISVSFINRTLQAVSHGGEFPDSEKQLCQRWEYDTVTSVRSSLVTEWNMVCGRTWMKSALASIFAVGWLIGNQVNGYFSDQFGRKKMTRLYSTMTAVLGIALPFCSTYTAFVVLRGLLGFFSSGASALYYTLAMEVLGAKARTAVSNIYWAMWAVEYMALAGVAYLFRERFTFMIVTAAPTVLIIIAGWLMPESIAWLVAKGKEKDAKKLLGKIARMNRKTLPPDFELTVQRDEDKSKTRITDLIRTRNLCRITLILALNWFANGVVFYSIAWNTPELHGNLYLNVFLAGFVEIPAYLLNIPLIKIIGRRWGISVTITLAGVVYLASLAPSVIAKAVLLMLAKFFITMSYSTTYLYTGELYPTVIRSLGLAVGNAFSRIGTFIAPFLPLLGTNITEIICGILCAAAALSVLTLPETVNQPLKSSVEEAEKHSRFEWGNIFMIPKPPGRAQISEQEMEPMNL